MRKLAVGLFAMMTLCSAALAQKHEAPPTTVPVVMLSDIHFDPFADPKKVDALRKAPASEWDAILRSPDTAQKDIDFAELQQTCRAKGVDPAMPLVVSSLKAAQATMPNPLFVTVSGDLMAHQFDCKFKTLEKDASEAEYSAFAAKTIAFLAWELHHTFPKSPVYISLGNNDSGCKDYREDEDSDYLKADAKSFAAVAMDAKNAAAIENTFPMLGDYSVTLPTPMAKTRLLVVQNIFESKSFSNCSGDKDEASAAKQVAWLRAQLAEARAKHEHVWVMGHIPPGVNVFAASSMGQKVCTTGNVADEFLSSEDLLDALTDYADTISLAIFAHTHMDEIRLLRGKGGVVAMKMVPSITTVGGNMSSFSVAQVDPVRAVMTDYAVYSADNKTGIDATWTKEYDFKTAYKAKDFSAASVDALTAGFLADPKADSDASKAYAKYYQTGTGQQAGLLGTNLGFRAIGLVAMWHEYACAASDGHAVAYRSCVCSASATK